MTTLLYCLLTPAAPPEEAFDRYTALRRKAPAVEAAFQTQGFSSTIVLSPTRMRLEMKGNGTDYASVINPEGLTELDRVARQYDGTDQVSRPTIPPSRMTEATQLVPRFLFVEDIRKAMPQGMKFASMGKKNLGGIACDWLQGSLSEGEGEAAAKHKADVLIDGTGVPRRVEVQGRSMMGAYRYEWTVSRMVAVQDPPADRFRLPIPDGYTPFSLSEVFGPVGVGNPFPMEGWQTTGASLRDRLGKGGIVAILDRESAASQRARTSLDRVGKAGTVVVILGDAPGVAGAAGHDAGGKMLDALKVPATPVFYRIDGGGKITAVWMGYDAAKAAEFERELQGK